MKTRNDRRTDGTALAILGAGGHGRVVAATARAAGYRDIVFLDDRWPELERTGDWPVVGRLGRPEGRRPFPGVGDNRIRERIFLQYGLEDSPTIVHPWSWVAEDVVTGAGCVVTAGCVVQTGVRLGRGVIVNTGSTIDHDCIIGDFVHVAPGAHLAGGVRVGARTWIGIGAVVRENVELGADVTVGAGSVVLADVPPGTTVVGRPARPLRARG